MRGRALSLIGSRISLFVRAIGFILRLTIPLVLYTHFPRPSFQFMRDCVAGNTGLRYIGDRSSPSRFSLDIDVAIASDDRETTQRSLSSPIDAELRRARILNTTCDSIAGRSLSGNVSH